MPIFCALKRSRSSHYDCLTNGLFIDRYRSCCLSIFLPKRPLRALGLNFCVQVDSPRKVAMVFPLSFFSFPVLLLTDNAQRWETH